MFSSNPLLRTAATGFSLFQQLNRFLARASKLFVASLLAINLTIVFVGVIFRYAFGLPLGWVYEVAIFLMMWSAFVGSAALSRDKAHVALDFIVQKFPLKLQSLVLAILGIAVIIFLLVVIMNSLTMIQGLMASRAAYTRIPMIWVYSSVPVGMGMVLLQQIEQLIGCGIIVITGEKASDFQE